jgi:hypothetical protein
MKLAARLVTALGLSILITCSVSAAGCFTDLDDTYLTNTYPQDIADKVMEGIYELPTFDYSCSATDSDGASGGTGVSAFTTAEFKGMPLLLTRPHDQKTYDSKIEPYNPIVRAKALEIASKNPGSYSIDQVCAIYDYLYNGWHYVNDPSSRGDYVNSASESIQIGEKAGCVGVGDCEDFAVLMASMVDAIGGKTRIIYTRNGESAHAYTEVYVGGGQKAEDNIANVKVWLSEHYGYKTKMLVFYHENWNTGEQWLNLDWAGDRPGGRFNNGDESYVLWESKGNSKPRTPNYFD